MDIMVLSKRDNILLDRVEVRFRIVHSNEKTPDRESVREKLSAILNEKKDMVIIDSMKVQFGKPESMGYAKVYKSKEKAMRVERDRTLVRNKLKERKVKAKEKAAAPKAEAPKAEAAKEKAPAPKAEAAKEKAPAPKAEAAKSEEKPAAAPKQAAPEKK